MNELYHHGILGQKWGVRRYQNEDGSLTPEGRKRYYGENGELTAAGKKAFGKEKRRMSKKYYKVSDDAIRKNYSFAEAYYDYDTHVNSTKKRKALESAGRNAIQKTMGKEAYNKPLNELLREGTYAGITTEGEYILRRTIDGVW